jgi:uncharacterized membrane protein YfhO
VTNEAFDPRSSIILESDAQPRAPGTADPAPPLVPAEITSYEPTRVVVRVNASHQGHLVLTDTFYPGWRATVDGRPTAIARANFLFRAVPIGAGVHEIVFTYEPRSFTVGATLGVLGLLALALVWRVNLRREL